ncbi:MAG: DUF1311 domain-containing protein [Bacteroidales bacterium]|nr:DUF1311 domain-containing protein [Bacteroidales bacterium]
MIHKTFFAGLALLLMLAFTGCGQTTDTPSAGTYWRAVSISHQSNYVDEFWADLFLWDEGAGYFRYTYEENEFADFLYGVECNWTFDGATLSLMSVENLSEGVFKNGVLTFTYDSYGELITIVMEQAVMKPYGAHWSVSDLRGDWRMTSYNNQNVDGLDRIVSSEICIRSPFHINFWQIDGQHILIDDGLEVSHHLEKLYEEDLRHIFCEEGAIWKGAKNQAWYVELYGIKNPAYRIFITFADNQLLLKKTHKDYPNVPFSMTAVYEPFEDELSRTERENRFVGEWKKMDDEKSGGNISIKTMTRIDLIGFSLSEYPPAEEERLFVETEKFAKGYIDATDSKGNSKAAEIGFVLLDDKLFASMINDVGGLSGIVDGAYTKSVTVPKKREMHPIELRMEEELQTAYTTADFRQVYTDAVIAWEEEMNKNYQTLMAKLGSDECRKKLETSQKAWLDFLENEISFNYGYWYYAGTMYATNSLNYRIQLVRERMNLLASYYDKDITSYDIYRSHKSSKTEEELDKLLNANYQALMKKYDKERQDRLRSVQRKWLIYRDAENDCYRSCCMQVINPDYPLFLIEERAYRLGSYLEDPESL